MDFSQAKIIETGGMKGRRKELSKAELHAILCSGLGVDFVSSEYGMTELLSQAYSLKNGVFVCPPWMKVLVREEDDPLRLQDTGRGVLNIIDLANVYSCSFIATDDVGEVFADGSFKVLGRRDNSDIRGCSLMAVS
jgi:MoaA/NifB/PqqE/SkfB family radical SAM enzyme